MRTWKLIQSECIRKKAVMAEAFKTALEAQFLLIEEKLDALKNSKDDETTVTDSEASEVLKELELLPMLRKSINEFLGSKLCCTNFIESKEEIFKLISENKLVFAYEKLFNLQKELADFAGSIETKDDFLHLYFGYIESLAQELVQKILASCSAVGGGNSKIEEIGKFLNKVVSKNVDWSTKTLESFTRYVINDLKFFTETLAKFFPPEYRIGHIFVSLYYDIVSKSLANLAFSTNYKNTGEDILRLTIWAQSNSGQNFLNGNNIPAAGLQGQHPLLPLDTMEGLYNEYIDRRKIDLFSWLCKLLKFVKEDFAKDSKYAIENDEKYYFSDLPFHLYSMLKDITSLPQEVPKNVINQIAENVCEQYGLFCFQLTTAVEKYKKEHLQNRDSTKQFTVTVVRTANDLHVSHKNVNNLLTKFLQESKKLQALTGSFNLAIKSTLSILFDQLYEDLQNNLSVVFTTPWLCSSDQKPVEDISETLKDYYENDYVYLHAPLRFALLEHILFKLASEYVLGIKDQKLAPSSSAERRKVVEKLREEFECINDLFSQFKENRGPNVPNFLQGITNIVACEKDLLASETAELLELCCDIPVELLSALINYREDVSSEEAKDIAIQAKQNAHPPISEEMKRFLNFCHIYSKMLFFV